MPRKKGYGRLKEWELNQTGGRHVPQQKRIRRKKTKRQQKGRGLRIPQKLEKLVRYNLYNKHILPANNPIQSRLKTNFFKEWMNPDQKKFVNPVDAVKRLVTYPKFKKQVEKWDTKYKEDKIVIKHPERIRYWGESNDGGGNYS